MNVDRIVKELKDGNIVVAPSDTVYGILGDALNEGAIEKVFIAKKRVSRKPLILLVSSKEMLYEYTTDLNSLEKELIDRYTPGKVTFILKKNDKVSNNITSGSEYVGIRIPKHKELIDIINKIGNPVISTSANIESKETITTIDKIEKEMLDHISYVDDGGEIISSPSTIIKVNNNKIEFLREGELASKIKEDYKLTT